MTKKTTAKSQDRKEKVEGEGSYSATRRYNEGLEKSVEQGDSEKLGAEARRALEGAEGDELRRAEADAKARGKAAGSKPQAARAGRS